MNDIESFLSGVAHLDGIARQAIREDWDDKDGYGAWSYAEHHAEELGLEELTDLDAFLSRISLGRLHYDADDDERHVVLDYTIGADVTQYVLAVAFGRDGEIDEIVMES